MQALHDTNNFFCVNTAYILPVDDKFLLGILNSRLIQFFYTKLSSSIRGGYLRFIQQYLEKIPIARTLSDEALQTLVEQLTKFNLDLRKETLPSNIQQLQTRIAHTEEKIDQLVYELYQLTPEEIKLVEAATHE